MKQVHVIMCAALLAGATAMAQQSAPSGQPANAPQTQAAPGQTAPAQPAAPAAKAPPQAKTQEEFKAYQEAATKPDPESAEVAADDFAAKFKESEIRGLLYQSVMQRYQAANNPDKVVEVGRKILAITPNDPVANVMVASMLAERTRDTDLDKDERLAEADKDANHALQTIDTDFLFDPNSPPERVAVAKAMLKSMAYSALGASASVKQNYPQAESYFKQAVSVPNAQVDAVTWLQYALVLDKAKKYQEAIVTVNKVFDLAPAGSPVNTLAKQERERLVKLAATPAPAAQQSTTPKQ